MRQQEIAIKTHRIKKKNVDKRKKFSLQTMFFLKLNLSLNSFKVILLSVAAKSERERSRKLHL